MKTNRIAVAAALAIFLCVAGRASAEVRLGLGAGQVMVPTSDQMFRPIVGDFVQYRAGRFGVRAGAEWMALRSGYQAAVPYPTTAGFSMPPTTTASALKSPTDYLAGGVLQVMLYDPARRQLRSYWFLRWGAYRALGDDPQFVWAIGPGTGLEWGTGHFVAGVEAAFERLASNSGSNWMLPVNLVLSLR